MSCSLNIEKLQEGGEIAEPSGSGNVLKTFYLNNYLNYETGIIIFGSFSFSGKDQFDWVPNVAALVWNVGGRE